MAPRRKLVLMSTDDVIIVMSLDFISSHNTLLTDCYTYITQDTKYNTTYTIYITARIGFGCSSILLIGFFNHLDQPQKRESICRAIKVQSNDIILTVISRIPHTMDKFWMTDRETTEAALTLLELHKADRARTKLSDASTTSNAGDITVRETILKDSVMANMEEPNTPRGSIGDTDGQPGPYPTPVSSSQKPSKGQPRTKRPIKYGRWSKSGRSWFANRRAIPGDRPPPQGATYSYRPVYFNEQLRSPTPEERYPSVIPSVESEPTITRPRRRRLYQRVQALDEQNVEVGPSTANEAGEPDRSSVDSNPIIIRRRGRIPVIRESRSATPAGITVGSYLSQQGRDSPFRETSIASDLYEGVQNRVRRRNKNLRRSKRLNPRSRGNSATPPVSTRTRTTQATARATPRKQRSRTAKELPIKLEDSDAEETVAKSPAQSEDPTEAKSESEEVATESPSRRDSPPQPSPQPSASWVRRSQRYTGAGRQNPHPETVDSDRMTLEEWVDEEDVLELTPPYLSSGSEYGGDG